MCLRRRRLSKSPDFKLLPLFFVSVVLENEWIACCKRFNVLSQSIAVSEATRVLESRMNYYTNNERTAVDDGEFETSAVSHSHPQGSITCYMLGLTNKLPLILMTAFLMILSLVMFLINDDANAASPNDAAAVSCCYYRHNFGCCFR